MHYCHICCWWIDHSFRTWGPKTKLWAELLRAECKKTNFLNLTSPFIACGLILLSSEMFRIVIGCKILLTGSMKFKFIHKISVIQERLLVFFNLLRGLYITCFGAGLHVVPPCLKRLPWEERGIHREQFEVKNVSLENPFVGNVNCQSMSSVL